MEFVDWNKPRVRCCKVNVRMTEQELWDEINRMCNIAQYFAHSDWKKDGCYSADVIHLFIALPHSISMGDVLEPTWELLSEREWSLLSNINPEYAAIRVLYV